MAKIAKFAAIFLLFLSALCGANLELISEFDRDFKTAKHRDKVRLHDEMRSLYMQSIIEDDKALQKRVLTRLITSSQALNLDASGFRSDLKALGGVSSQPEPKAAPRPLFLLSATKKNQTLELKFNQPLDAQKLRTFAQNEKNLYRNILEIDGSVNGKNLTYKNFIVDEIRVYQYTRRTIRIVFSDKAQKTVSAHVANDTLIVSLKNFISQEKVKPAKEQPKLSSTYEPVSKTPENKTKPPVKESTKSTAPATPANASSKTIVIDPGHGGSDPGAQNGALQEKTAVLSVSKKLGERLKKRGYKVFYTRTNDTFLDLRPRTKFANDKMADLFLSIHANAAPNAKRAKEMEGIETFFLSPARSERSKNAAALENKSDIEEMNYFSQQTFLNVLNREKIIASNKLGIDMQREILASVRKRYTVSDGGVREAPFWVLVGALMPAVLIEIGYITHETEGKRLFEEDYQDALADGIASGVDAYFAKNR